MARRCSRPAPGTARIVGAQILLSFLVSSALANADEGNRAVSKILPEPSHGPGVRQSAIKRHAVQVYGRLPLHFESNPGQTDERVKFLSRGRGYTLFLTADEVVLTLRKGKPRVEGEDSRIDHPSHRCSFNAPAFRGPLESPATELEKNYALQDQSPSLNPEPRSPSHEFLPPAVLRFAPGDLVGAGAVPQSGSRKRGKLAALDPHWKRRETALPENRAGR